MDKNFGIKDFFLFTLIAFVIILIVLTMVQVDRQWRSIQVLTEKADEQSRDLIDMKRMLQNGAGAVPMSAASRPAGDAMAADDPAPKVDLNGKPWIDPFYLTKDAHKMSGFSSGDWLVDNFGAKLKGATPFIGNDIPAAYVQEKIFEGLLYRDVNTLAWVPLLARAWKASSDGLTFTFYLRPNITFSDGEPMTADDVVFTFDWVRNPAVNAPRERSGLDKLKDVKKIDDLTVQFTFTDYYFKGLETVGSMFVMPKHFYSKYTPEQFNQSAGLLMGTGPYRMQDPTSWTPGQPIILYRNDRYWGTPPPPDRLVWNEVEEEVAIQTMFGNGELDSFAATAEQYVKLKDDPKTLKISNPYEYTDMMNGYTYVSWNEAAGGKPTIFADKRVRQAMTMILDRDAITRDVFLGYANVANGPFAPGSKQADPAVKPWPYDPARALKMLEDVGIKDTDGDGVLNKPDGTAFHIKLTYPSKSAVYDRVTLMMKDNFAKAHIVLDRDPVEWPLLQKKLENHDFDSIMLAWSGTVDDDPYQMFDSSQMSDQGDNQMSYNSPELDTAIRAARSTVDEKQRNELWHKVHRILAEDCPYTFLINRQKTIFLNNRWQNIQKSTMGLNYNKYDFQALPWFAPKSQQRYTK